MTDQSGPPQGPQWGPPPVQPPQGPPPKKKKRKKWPWVVGGIVVLFVIGGINTAVNGVSGSNTTTVAATPNAITSAPASTTQQAAATATPAAPTPQPPPKPSAETQYVTKQAHDAHVVVVSFQEVQGGVQILSQGNGDAATMASFQQLLSQAKDGFDSAQRSFVLADSPKGLGDANDEAVAALQELSDGMSSARAYVDNRKPSDLAAFGTHWGQGRKWWNEAVNKLWGAAHQPAPTV